MTTFSIIQKSQLEGARRIDAQYFQTEYIQLEKDIYKSNKYKKWKDLDGEFITGPFGSEFDTANYIEKGEFRYIRGKDVRPFFILENDNVYIPLSDFEKLHKYSLINGDILISVVGTLGFTAIVDNKIIPAIFSCKSTVFRSGRFVNPFYLIAYLNSKYGYQLLIRNERGANQTGLNIKDLKTLPIYVPSISGQKMIGQFIIDSKQSLEDSSSYYLQAKNLLLEELGLKDFQVQDNLSFDVNLSDVKSASRIDAEYFHPKYQILVGQIKKHNAKLLGDLVLMKKGFEPGSEAYQEEGKLFIRVSSVSKFGIDNKDQKYLSDNLYQELKKNFEPKVGEILLTKDATPGIAYVLKDVIEGIISGGIVRLKVNSDINAEYLAMCISSLIGQMQAGRDAGGSIIAHWKPEQINSLLIPVLPKETQEKIAELVRKSHEARKKSKELLEEAKRRVEEMIEKGSKN